VTLIAARLQTDADLFQFLATSLNSAPTGPVVSILPVRCAAKCFASNSAGLPCPPGAMLGQIVSAPPDRIRAQVRRQGLAPASMVGSVPKTGHEFLNVFLAAAQAAMTPPQLCRYSGL